MSPLAAGLANVFGILVVLLGVSAVLSWVERRWLGFWQDRYGPDRAGPGGMLQIVADMIKILFKQDWTPPFADRPVFIIAPALVMITVFLAFGVVPVSPAIGVAGNLNVGNDRTTLLAVLTQLLSFIGYPRTLNGLAAVNEIVPAQEK